MRAMAVTAMVLPRPSAVLEQFLQFDDTRIACHQRCSQLYDPLGLGLDRLTQR
jgi:hypothetical protein